MFVTICLVCFLGVLADVSGGEDSPASLNGGEPGNLANQLLRRTGFNVKDLPEDLMETGADLYQLAKNASGPIQTILVNVQGMLETNTSLAKIKETFLRLLTDAEFVRAAKRLMDEHKGNAGAPLFQRKIERMLLVQMQENGAGELTASVVCVVVVGFLGLVVVVRGLDFLI
ncbi:uncharacterized protein LOC143292957 [Babylonia areolata]|uniref:uncharacterized protein LOC143292957 n=1 Tax=Babylonia areolata TaxID=304850 RepID=UPI003FCFEB61